MRMGRRLPAGIAFALLLPALLASVAGTPMRGEGDVMGYVASRFTLDSVEGTVAPELLGRWIMEGGRDLTVVDVRPAEAYRSYHIPGAVHRERAGASVAGDGGIVVLCGETGEEGMAARRRWQARGAVPVSLYVLEGGLQGWTERILHPSIPVRPSPWAAAMYEAIRPISLHLGGLPRRGVPPEKATLRDLPPRLETVRGAHPSGRSPGTFRRGC